MCGVRSSQSSHRRLAKKNRTATKFHIYIFLRVVVGVSRNPTKKMMDVRLKQIIHTYHVCVCVCMCEIRARMKLTRDSEQPVLSDRRTTYLAIVRRTLHY